MKKLVLIVCSIFVSLSCKDNDPSPNSRNVASLEKAVIPLEGVDDLDTLIAAIGDSRFVLLGEASHGTAEFYEWRAEISKRLIAERGFNVIAVEGDWPDLYRLNKYINGIN
jgi:erythromycin esterase